ncbi:MAG: tripartite tricarboxylate transporter substrate binding protein [Burkholderiales bacterium]|nr:tripartite tricarboxylate transporter substrate binding protein [Burkholderiales bacterium]
MIRFDRFFTVFVLALGLASGTASAQTWPSRPVKLVVPFPPGGGTDGVARVVAQGISTELGQSVIVENKSGAGGTIGANAVATSTADGYTIGLATSSTHPAAMVLRKDVPYHALKSFAPVTQIASTSYVLLGSPGLPVSSLGELIAYAKANPGKLNFANVGTSTLGYLLTRQFRALSGVDMLDVSYKGSAQVYPNLMANQVQLFLDNPGASTTLVEAGKVKAFAVTTPTPSMPGVPLFSEAGKTVGLQGFNSEFWYGIVAPAGTPSAIVERLRAVIAKYVNSPEGRKAFAMRSLEPVGNTPGQFAATIQNEIDRFSALAKQFDIQPQ